MFPSEVLIFDVGLLFRAVIIRSGFCLVELRDLDLDYSTFEPHHLKVVYEQINFSINLICLSEL